MCCRCQTALCYAADGMLYCVCTSARTVVVLQMCNTNGTENCSCAALRTVAVLQLCRTAPITVVVQQMCRTASKTVAVLQMPGCKVCPRPAEVRCEAVEGAEGRFIGKCQSASGIFYACLQDDCRDTMVEALCPKGEVTSPSLHPPNPFLVPARRRRRRRRRRKSK